MSFTRQPKACAESKYSLIPFAAANSARAFASQAPPHRFTPMIALTPGSIRAATWSTEIWCVSGSTSQKTGWMLVHVNDCADAMKKNAGSITFPDNPMASATIISAMVALVTQTACLTPRNCWSLSSSCSVKGPWFV